MSSEIDIMIKNRVLLWVNRFRQKPNECAIAASTSIAHYYDASVEYKEVRQMIPYRKRKYGLSTWQQCTLLNKLGFDRISVVTFDLEFVDFSWSKLSKNGLLRKLHRLSEYYGQDKAKDEKQYVDESIKWLEDEKNDNNIIIDHDLPKYIRKEINQRRPVGACFNWTSTFRFRKSPTTKGYNGEYGGETEDHAIVIRGYDDSGIFVVDSHHKHYTGKRKKYRNGYYKLSWETFLVNVPMGDLILADYT